jgi:hypothetical protein
LQRALLRFIGDHGRSAMVSITNPPSMSWKPCTCGMSRLIRRARSTISMTNSYPAVKMLAINILHPDIDHAAPRTRPIPSRSSRIHPCGFRRSSGPASSIRPPSVHALADFEEEPEPLIHQSYVTYRCRWHAQTAENTGKTRVSPDVSCFTCVKDVIVVTLCSYLPAPN